MKAKRIYNLIGKDGKPYESVTPGSLGGNTIKKNDRIYGKLDCPAAKRAIDSSGDYAKHRVFFANEEDAIAAGFRPCGRCMPKEYKESKERTAK